MISRLVALVRKSPRGLLRSLVQQAPERRRLGVDLGRMETRGRWQGQEDGNNWTPSAGRGVASVSMSAGSTGVPARRPVLKSSEDGSNSYSRRTAAVGLSGSRNWDPAAEEHEYRGEAPAEYALREKKVAREANC